MGPSEDRTTADQAGTPATAATNEATGALKAAMKRRTFVRGSDLGLPRRAVQRRDPAGDDPLDADPVSARPIELPMILVATPGVRDRSRRAVLAATTVMLLLAGCGVNPPHVTPLATTGAVPDLRGTWTGTWGGTPLTLLLVEQAELGSYTGLYLGPWQLLGERTPSVSGVMTSTIRGAPVSVNAQGWLGTLNGRLALVVAASPSGGTQYVTLTVVEPSRLAGSGESEFPWGPRGPVELVRRSQ